MSDKNDIDISLSDKPGTFYIDKLDVVYKLLERYALCLILYEQLCLRITVMQETVLCNELFNLSPGFAINLYERGKIIKIREISLQNFSKFFNYQIFVSLLIKFRHDYIENNFI